MNQNCNKDNDLQRAIDEITQKNTGPAPKPSNANPAPAQPPVAPVGAPKPPVSAAQPAMAPQMPAGMPTGMPSGYGRSMSYGADISKVKEAALKELFPIMDRVEVEPEKRFLLYQEMLTTMRDKAVIAPAYEAARQIRDDKVRADSLLYLINSIDEMSL